MERKFKYITVPADVWLCKGDLTLREMWFFMEIDSLDNDAGCYASNTHFSKSSKLSKSRCTEVIKSLEKKGLITIRLVRKGKLIVKRIIKISDTGKVLLGYSKNRIGVFEKPKNPIRKTEEPYSENTKERVTVIELQKESDTRAIDFLKKTNLSQWETFCMQYKSHIDDFVKFSLDFNDVYDDEKRVYEVGAIVRRLGRYARNWISISRGKKHTNTNTGPKLVRLN